VKDKFNLRNSKQANFETSLDSLAELLPCFMATYSSNSGLEGVYPPSILSTLDAS